MCLVDCTKIKTNEDVICYKVVKNINNVIFSSPFKSATIWEIGKQKEIKNTAISNLKKYSLYKQKVITNSYMHKIYGCAYHTFTTEEDAFDYIKKSRCENAFFRFSVLKCVIPKSSKYVYEGTFSITESIKYKSYASQKLKPIELIKHERRRQNHNI